MSFSTKKMYLHRTAAAPTVEPALPRRYDADFHPSEEYKESLPDMMEAVAAAMDTALV